MAFRLPATRRSLPRGRAGLRAAQAVLLGLPEGVSALGGPIAALLGQDPKRRFGRNGDIDLAELASVEFPIHCRVRLSASALERKDTASAFHRSQLTGGPQRGGVLARMMTRFVGNHDDYMRAYPEAPAGLREPDLFA